MKPQMLQFRDATFNAEHQLFPADFSSDTFSGYQQTGNLVSVDTTSITNARHESAAGGQNFGSERQSRNYIGHFP